MKFAALFRPAGRKARLMMWCAAASIFLGSAAIHAHEIGTTQVSVVFQQSTAYEIEIVTDAVSLVEKLEALSGQTPPSDPTLTKSRTAAALEVQLQAYDEVFRRRMVVAFDEAAVRPAIDYAVSGIVTATSSPVATIRMKGAIPQEIGRASCRERV